MPKSAARQFLVKVSGVDGFWARKTGGETQSDVTKVYDGGSLTPDILTSPQDTTDITVVRPYDPVRDQPVVNRLRPLVGRRAYGITVEATDRDLVRVGQRETYLGILTRVKAPDVDAGSGNAAEVELTFAIQNVTR